MFTELEQCSWIRIDVTRVRSTQEYFQGLREACVDAALSYRRVARWVKASREDRIDVTRGRSIQEYFQGLREACDDAALSYRRVARWVKASREDRNVVHDNLRTGRPHAGNNTVQFLASLLDADRRLTELELAAVFGVFHKTVLHILHDIVGYRKLAARWIPYEISKVQQWLR